MDIDSDAAGMRPDQILSLAARRGVDDVLAIREAIHRRIDLGEKGRDESATRLAAVVYAHVVGQGAIRTDRSRPHDPRTGD